MKAKLVFSNGLFADIVCKGWGVALFHFENEQDAIKKLNEFKHLCNKNGRTVLIEGETSFTFAGPYSNGQALNMCTYAVLKA